MDSGSVAFDPDSESEFDFAATGSPEEIIWLMDELFCREVRSSNPFQYRRVLYMP